MCPRNDPRGTETWPSRCNTEGSRYAEVCTHHCFMNYWNKSCNALACHSEPRLRSPSRSPPSGAGGAREGSNWRRCADGGPAGRRRCTCREQLSTNKFTRVTRRSPALRCSARVLRSRGERDVVLFEKIAGHLTAFSSSASPG